jgi:hypothetical protein
VAWHLAPRRAAPRRDSCFPGHRLQVAGGHVKWLWQLQWEEEWGFSLGRESLMREYSYLGIKPSWVMAACPVPRTC